MRWEPDEQQFNEGGRIGLPGIGGGAINFILFLI